MKEFYSTACSNRPIYKIISVCLYIIIIAYRYKFPHGWKALDNRLVSLYNLYMYIFYSFGLVGLADMAIVYNYLCLLTVVYLGNLYLKRPSRG